MRSYSRNARSRIPAVELRSVAVRYGHPLVCLAGGRLRTLPPTDEIESPPPAATHRDPLTARLEAVLFLAREPLHPRRLARLANLADGTQARTLVVRLNSIYDAEQRAFRAEEVGGGFQLRTRHQFAPWLRRLQHVPVELRLSQPALETLAVIAYRQPVLRADVDAIRGVQCGEVIRQLMERDLVRIAGRSAELGRPYFYGTTRKFLQVFGLRDLSDLPRADLLRQSGSTTGEISTDANRIQSEGEQAVTVSSATLEFELPLLAEVIDDQVSILRAQDADEDWEEGDEEEKDDEDDDEDEDWDDEDEDEDWEEEDLDEDESDLEEEDWDEDEEDWDEDEDDDDWEEVDDEDLDDEDDEDDDEDWEEEEEDEGT